MCRWNQGTFIIHVHWKANICLPCIFKKVNFANVFFEKKLFLITFMLCVEALSFIYPITGTPKRSAYFFFATLVLMCLSINGLRCLLLSSNTSCIKDFNDQMPAIFLMSYICTNSSLNKWPPLQFFGTFFKTRFNFLCVLKNGLVKITTFALIQSSRKASNVHLCFIQTIANITVFINSMKNK